MTKGKKGNDMVTTPNGDEVQAIPASEKVQPLTAPDYEKLSATIHEVTEGAKLPGDVDATEKEPAERGRGRPRLTDEERNAAREARRLKDKARRTGTTKKQSDAPPDLRAAVAQSNAAMICKVLDVMSASISAGEYVPSAEQQAATTGVWAAYLFEQGYELPGWVQVCVVSSMHVLPAFATNHGKSKIAGMWARMKGWWVMRGT